VHFDQIVSSSSFWTKQTTFGVCWFRENKQVYLEDWVWEKGGGILDGHLLTEFWDQAM